MCLPAGPGKRAEWFADGLDVEMRNGVSRGDFCRTCTFWVHSVFLGRCVDFLGLYG